MARAMVLFGLLACVSLLAGCASSAGPIERPDLSPPTRLVRYLISPVENYPDDLIPARRAELVRAFEALVERGETEVARAAARALLDRDPGLVGAELLLAQADFVDERVDDTFRTLSAALQDYPDYVPGQLLLGRAAELTADTVRAYGAYRRASADARARERLRAIEATAMGALRKDIDRQLEADEVEVAEQSLVMLMEWFPDRIETVESRRRVAVAVEDPERELEAVRLLNEVELPERDLQVRQATLEIEVGDPEAAVGLYERLNDSYPNDPELIEGLAAAKFRWRLQMLPEDVAAILTQSSGQTVTRGDFAGLLYWVVPGLRSGRSDGGRIVSDVLGHPQRNAIMRVVNLGILDVADETLHQFSPERTIRRGDALSGLLNSARYLGVRPSCLREYLSSGSAGSATVCKAAARCGLIVAESECKPGSELKAHDASEVIRRTLELLDAR